MIEKEMGAGNTMFSISLVTRKKWYNIFLKQHLQHQKYLIVIFGQKCYLVQSISITKFTNINVILFVVEMLVLYLSDTLEEWVIGNNQSHVVYNFVRLVFAISSIFLFWYCTETLYILSFYVLWWLRLYMPVTCLVLLSSWRTHPRFHQWAGPGLNIWFMIWEVCGTKWNIRRIKNWIHMTWRTKRIA